MKKFLLPVLAIALLSAASNAFAQAPAPSASDTTNLRIHQLDLLVKLVPLALQKDQFPDLLAGLDAAKAIQKKEQDAEDVVLAGLDADVAAAVENGEKGSYPPRELQNRVAKSIDQMSSRQFIVTANMIKVVFDTIKAKLNVGQRKAMAGSFLESYIDPRMKPEDITEDVKINFFVRNVLLDPIAYDLLVEMSKHAS